MLVTVLSSDPTSSTTGLLPEGSRETCQRSAASVARGAFPYFGPPVHLPDDGDSIRPVIRSEALQVFVSNSGDRPPWLLLRFEITT